MFSAILGRTQSPFTIEGRIEEGKIVGFTPSGIKNREICPVEERNFLDRIIFERIFQALEIGNQQVTIIDPITHVKTIRYVDRRAIPALEFESKSQKESRVIRDLLKQRLRREDFGKIEEDAIHAFCMEENFSDFDHLEVKNVKMIRYKDRWHVVDSTHNGSFLSVAVTKEVAFKHLINGSNEQMRAVRAANFLEIINPEDAAVGVEKRPISPLKPRLFSSYILKEGGLKSIGCGSVAVQVEKTFPCSCQDAVDKRWIVQEEIPSLVACLLQGSQEILAKGVYPLDVKLENMSYLGRGKAAHVDLRGSLERHNGIWVQPKAVYTTANCVREELFNLNHSDGDIKQHRAEKLHIFLLGMSFIRLATGRVFYQREKVGDFYFISRANYDLNAVKSFDRVTAYNQKQKEIILKMVETPENRPSIEEIQAVFPLSLIKDAKRLSKNQWELT